MSAGTRSLVAIEGLTVEVAGRVVLDQMHLTLAEGAAVGLIGPSGCGKTTTALAVLGHLRDGMRRRAGTVRVRGAEVFPPPTWLRGRTVAYVPQDPGHTLNPYQRVGAALLDSLTRLPPRRARRDAVVELLDRVGLPADPEFARRYPHQLSGGQQQRIALAMALSRSPALLILDEPTTGLDMVTKAGIVDELRRVHRSGTALLWISHDVETLARSVDRVVTMGGGRLTSGRHPTGHRRERAPQQPGSRETALLAAASSPTLHGAGPVLSVRGLTAGHPRTQPVLLDVDLDVAPGECVAVLGVSGTGKTTLARCLAGLHPPRSGALRLDGVLAPWDIRRRTRAQRAALQLVAQSPAEALHPRQTVRTALVRPLRLLRGVTDRERLQDEINRLLLTVRLAPSTPIASPRSSPAVSVKGCPSPGRWRPGPASSCATRARPRWTPTPSVTCSPCWRKPAGTWGSPCCSSPIASTWPPARTGWSWLPTATSSQLPILVAAGLRGIRIATR
ncbi:hypothetical protein SVIO_103360 [Streptomyces violaceusniger]|uniref:ABC transporter domain-containing protein n=1 Tax=Streptomyces violaceusniger TaxID=68280 RepID=A0A4D4LNU0_STRVO|nr:hypothetical protein SVIO_103360 [Streptomyces violaceusniger]